MLATRIAAHARSNSNSAAEFLIWTPRAPWSPPKYSPTTAPIIASTLAIFKRVRIPNALPYIFSALKVASVLAMIGAVVGEYFGGSVEALGVQIRNSAALFAFETAWAAILVASILGICFYLSIALLERLTTGWQPSARTIE